MKFLRFIRYLYFFTCFTNSQEEGSDTKSGVCGYDSKNEPICCTSYIKGPYGTCLLCEYLNVGDNCTLCEYPWYGFRCRNSCAELCSPPYCHPFKGCLNYIYFEEKTSINDGSLMSKSTLTMEMAALSTKWTLQTKQVTVSAPPGEKELPTNLIIIITGSVLCFCLVIIIINQFHGKLKKKHRNLATHQQSPNPPEVEEYQLIDDVIFTSSAYNYDQIRNKSLKEKKIIEDRSEYHEIDETKSLPNLPSRPSKTDLDQIKIQDTKDLDNLALSISAGSSQIVVNSRENRDYDYPDIDSESQKKNKVEKERIKPTVGTNEHQENTDAEEIYDKESNHEQHKYDYPDCTDINSSRDSYLTPTKPVNPNTYIQIIEGPLTNEHLSKNNTDSNKVIESHEDEYLTQQHAKIEKKPTLPYDDVLGIQKDTRSDDVLTIKKDTRSDDVLGIQKDTHSDDVLTIKKDTHSDEQSQNRENDPTYLDVVDK